MQVADLVTFKKIVESIESKPDYVRPQAFGMGVATVDADGRILSAHFPVPNFQANFGSAAIMAEVLGYTNGTRTVPVNGNQLDEILSYFTPFENDGKQHPNIEVMKSLRKVIGESDKKIVIVTFIAASSAATEVADAYLRLHLLSHGLAKSDEINLVGIDKVFTQQVLLN